MNSTPYRPLGSPQSFPSGRAYGFTLIEILIVVAVLGILAALAVPRFSGAKEKALVAAMTADLHSAAFYEELYATEHAGTYFSGAPTATTAVQGFRTSPGVTMTLVAYALPADSGSSLPAWTAVARHAGSDKRCESTGGVIHCATAFDQAIGEISN